MSNSTLDSAHNQDRVLSPPLPMKNQSKRRCFIAIGAVLVLILLLLIVVLILALTVFKPKQPQTQVQSSKIEGVAPNVSLIPFEIQLNVTLDLEILVKNPNHASFKHGSGKSILDYRGNQIGEADIYPGFIPAAGSTTFPCRLTLQVQELASNVTSLITDILGGQLVMETHTKIPGRVNFLGIFKKHVVTSSDCKFSVAFPSLNITSQECKSKL